MWLRRQPVRQRFECTDERGAYVRSDASSVGCTNWTADLFAVAGTVAAVAAADRLAYICALPLSQPLPFAGTLGPAVACPIRTAYSLPDDISIPAADTASNRHAHCSPDGLAVDRPSQPFPFICSVGRAIGVAVVSTFRTTQSGPDAVSLADAHR
jgi:hypothetical protein